MSRVTRVTSGFQSVTSDLSPLMNLNLWLIFLGHSSPVCSQSVTVCSLVEPCHGKNDENQNIVYVSTMFEPLAQKERRHQHSFLTLPQM